MASVIKVPVPKAKGQFIDIDTGEIPDPVYQEALVIGLKALLGRGMTKITKTEYPDEAELATAALAKAESNFADMKAGKIRLMATKATSSKAGGKVMTEARRLAKQVVKDAMKRKGIKVSYVEASEITKAANAYLTTDAGKELIDQAKTNIEASEAKSEATADVLDTIVTTGMISEKKKAKVEAERATAKAQLSATQAGKVKPTKPQANA